MDFEDNALAHLRPGQRLARVSASQGERARVMLDGAELDAVVAGALSYAAVSAADLPVTGDWVAVRQVDPALALIEQVLPRRSKIARRAAGRRAEEQVLAAQRRSGMDRLRSRCRFQYPPAGALPGDYPRRGRHAGDRAQQSR